jgi:hypothetical protein
MTTINVYSGQVVPFVAYQFNTFGASAGSYTFTMTTVGFAGAINLYQNFFDPTVPNANFYANGVVATKAGTVSQTLSLPANSLFEVVFSAASTGASGSFAATISGPGNVNISTSPTVSIRVGPKSQTIASGNSATLRVYAIGPLPQTWQWYVGESGVTTNPIAGATSPVYTTPPLISDQSYWVRVAGPGRGDTADAGATITVTGNPNANFSGSVAPGGCNLNDGSLYAVQRFQIQSQGNYVFNITPGFTLTTYETIFDPLHPQANLWGILNGFYAAGTYDLVISKPSPGGAFSGAIGGGPAIVNLVPALPPQFLSSPQDTTILPGQKATLNASMTCGTPFTLQWYQGLSGDVSTPISGATTSSYTSPALSTDTSYWTRMTFSGGHADSATANVFVTTGPISQSGELNACDRTFNRPASAGVLSGLNCFYKTFVFRVPTDGSYTFSVQPTGFQAWSALYQGIFAPSNPLVNLYSLGAPGGDLTSSLISGPNYYYLVISSALPGATGPFTVTVTAGPSLVTKSPAPVITTGPANTNLFQNQHATLNVVSPSLGATYQWYTGVDCASKNAIPGANSNYYTTPPISSLQHYWVEVTASPGGYLVSSEATVGIIGQVQNVTSSIPDGAYPAGQTIPITVSFNLPVDVTGTPQLQLNSGGVAAYASGNGTATLTFNYLVGPGQASARLDY